MSESKTWNAAIDACLLVVESDSYCVPNPPTLQQYREMVAAQMRGLKRADRKPDVCKKNIPVFLTASHIKRAHGAT